jgi:hypothetical protein
VRKRRLRALEIILCVHVKTDQFELRGQMKYKFRVLSLQSAGALISGQARNQRPDFARQEQRRAGLVTEWSNT